MNGAVILFTNFGFSIKKILVIIIATLLLILMFPILAISSLGLPAVSFLANTPSAKAAEERGFYSGGVMPLTPGMTTPSATATSSTIRQRLAQFFRLTKVLMDMLRM